MLGDFLPLLFIERSASDLDGVYLIGTSKYTPAEDFELIHYDPRRNLEYKVGRIPIRKLPCLASLQSEFVFFYDCA